MSVDNTRASVFPPLFPFVKITGNAPTSLSSCPSSPPSSVAEDAVRACCSDLPASMMQVDTAGDEQAEKEATVSKEERDLTLLASAVVKSRAQPTGEAPSSPVPRSGDETPPPSLTRTLSLLDSFELDECALREVDSLFTALQEGRPLPPPPPPLVPDIESLVPPHSTPRFIPLSRYPLSILAVTALSSQLWCEEQTHLSLTFGRRVSPSAQLAMDRGTARHEELEREVHDIVHVEVRGREEEWGLRMLNGVVGLHELMLVGKTRELLVMSRIERREGEAPFWLMGVIDEVERVEDSIMEVRRLRAEEQLGEERRRAEERMEKRRQKEEQEKLRLAENARQMEERKRRESIKRHLIVKGGGGSEPGRAVSYSGPEDEEMLQLLKSYEEMQEEDEKRRKAEQEEMEAKGREEKRLRLAERAKEARRQNRSRMQLSSLSSSFVISDNKTRAIKGLPSIAQQRTTRMQLSTYKWMFDSLATALSPPPPVTSSDLKGTWTADQLMEAMGLNPSASFTSSFILHLAASGFPPTTTLRELIDLYLHTFSSLLLPSSPYLCVHYEHQLDASSLGSSLFTFDALIFQLDLAWLLGYWMGDRESEGVMSGEQWKCQRCEYVVECGKTKWEGKAGKVIERRLEERKAKEAADREREKRKAREAEKEERAEEEKRRQKEAQRERDRARLNRAESDDDGEDDDAGVSLMVKAEREEVKDGEDAVEGAAAAAAKLRRGRKRRSLEELTMSQEDGKEVGSSVVKKEEANVEVIYIDCS